MLVIAKRSGKIPPSSICALVSVLTEKSPFIRRYFTRSVYFIINQFCRFRSLKADIEDDSEEDEGTR